MRKYVAEGRVKTAAFIWHKGMKGWEPIVEVEPFKSHFVGALAEVLGRPEVEVPKKKLPEELAPSELTARERGKRKKVALVLCLIFFVGAVATVFVLMGGGVRMNPTLILVATLTALIFTTGGAIIYSFRRVGVLLRLLEDKSIELKQADEQLRKAHEELKSLDKMKTDFMNMAAHELRTPLVPMVGYIHLIDRKKLSEEDCESLDIILRNTERLRRLVTDVLDISKLESKVMKFKMEDVQMVDLIKNSAADAKPFAKQKGISLEAKDIPKLPLVHGDPMRLTQVLGNLINNAIKFTDKGGVTIEARTENGKVVVEVTDTGIGMPDDDLPKLFTKFFQAKTPEGRRYGGTGLGLAICKEIIKAHKGEVWARSKLGKGSTFGFDLPAKS